MITVNNKLEIFENFVKDPSLKKKKSDVEQTTVSGGSFNFGGIATASNSFSRAEDVVLVDYLHYVHMHERSIKSWLKLKLAETLFSNKRVKKIKYQSVDDFFKNIKDSVKHLEIDESAISFYTTAIENAIENGQIALKETLADRKNTVLSEMLLLKHNVTKYVDEADVVSFFSKSKLPRKVLKLTWIKNYVRVIPEDVMKLKKKFDEKEVFDNYVVLHFDKDDNSTEMTKAEKEKAKDPILFGVISGSRKLYYIGDWIDEYCDLTLDKFLDTLQMENARKLTKDSIKKEILST